MILDTLEEQPLFLSIDYTKAEVAGLINEFENQTIICNVRIDTAIYELAPALARKRDCPRKDGKRISLLTCQNDDWKIGVCLVLTAVYAFVTAPCLLPAALKH